MKSNDLTTGARRLSVIGDQKNSSVPAAVAQRSLARFDHLCRPPFARLRRCRFPVGFVIDGHKHSFHQLLAVLGGGMAFDAGGEPLTLRSGSLVWIPAGTIHGFRSIGRGWLELIDLGILEQGMLPALAPTLRVGRSREPFAAIAQRSWEEGRRGDSWSEIALAGLARELYAMGGRAISSMEPRSATVGVEAIVQRLRRSIAVRYAERLTLSDLAGDAGCSPQHLCRLLRTHLGTTPMALLSETRLATAATLLADGSTVVAATEQSGFSDVRHFARLFRARYGVAPGGWRAQGHLGG